MRTEYAPSFLYTCINTPHPFAEMTCMGLSRGWSHCRTGCLCATTAAECCSLESNKMSISSLIYSCWLFICMCINDWPPVKTVPTHFRGPKWALIGWHSAGLMSLLLWHCVLPVFCCHLLPMSGHSAGRGQMSRLVLEIQGRCAVFTSHLTDTPRCFDIVQD